MLAAEVYLERIWQIFKQFFGWSGVGTAPSTVSLATKDAGPYQTVNRVYTTLGDMSTATPITQAVVGKKLVAMDILISVDTAMSFTIQEETSGTVYAKFYLPANGTVQITPRGYLKTSVLGRRFMGKASVSGNVAVTVIYFSED